MYEANFGRGQNLAFATDR